MKPLIGATLCVLALGCASPSTSSTADAEPAGERADGGREVDGHVLPPIDNMSDVMLAKLAHTQAIIEGISVSNFDQIRLNAVDLFEISKKTEWMVQDTVTYTVISEDFRQAVTALADDAGAGNSERVKDDFFRMTETCIDCHTYLRRERQFKGMPGEVSHQSAPALLDQVTLPGTLRDARS